MTNMHFLYCSRATCAAKERMGASLLVSGGHPIPLTHSRTLYSHSLYRLRSLRAARINMKYQIAGGSVFKTKSIAGLDLVLTIITYTLPSLQHGCTEKDERLIKKLRIHGWG